MRAALLARVSDESQAESDRHSLPAQLRAMRERCAREGWEVAATFEAPGESASTRFIDRRPVLRALVNEARAGAFDVVLFHESSRLARDEELAQWLINELEAVGVRLVEADQPADAFYSPDGRFIYSMKSGLNAWQSRKHGSQVAKGYRERFERGLHTGDVPFGYRWQLRENADGTTSRATDLPVEPVPDEADAIREAFRDRVSGAGPFEVAQRLNARGFRPRSKQGNPVFTLSAAQSLLENDFYCGYVRHKGARRRGAHEAVISEDLWQAAQLRLRDHRHAPRAKAPRMLSGLAVCSECAGPLWVMNSGRQNQYATYREPSRYRGRSCTNGGLAVRAEVVEAQVGAAVSAMALDRSWLAHVDAEARRVWVDDGIEAERERLLGEKRRLTHAWLRPDHGGLDEGEYDRIMDALEDRLARLPSPLPTGLLFSGARLSEVGQVWSVMTREEAREACRLLFERVEMDVRGGQVWLRPHAEFEGLFRSRRGYVLATYPRKDSNPGSNLNPKPWLYLTSELTGAVG